MTHDPTERAKLVAAASLAFGGPKRVSVLIGCSHTLISQITAGKKRLTTHIADRLTDALRDHAHRCERLADMIEMADVAPRPCRAATGPRDARGCFVRRVA